jgi:hypothetical protein
VDSSGLGYGLVAESCEIGNESSGSKKDGGYLDSLSTYQLLKNDSSKWI